MNAEVITLRINGHETQALFRPGETLLTVLRDRLGMTGTKTNCREGECGLCGVELDGRATNACLVDARMAQGSDIVTIEGVEDDDGLALLQSCFIECGAVQCGYCIPAMIINARSLLRENPKPSRDEIRTGLAGVLCRCTGYQKIVDAVERASKIMNQMEGA